MVANNQGGRARRATCVPFDALPAADLRALAVGHRLQNDHDVRVLSWLARGRYVEIGTCFGGSAMVAGRAGCLEVHCIDPWAGYGNANPEDVIANWAAAGLPRERLFLHRQANPPWPPAASGVFDIGLIDGRHTTDAVLADWEEMRKRVTGHVLFHDYKNGTVLDMARVSAAFEVAIKDPEWEEIEVTGSSAKYGILRRVSA